jgi:hypothetical protein
MVYTRVASYAGFCVDHCVLVPRAYFAIDLCQTPAAVCCSIQGVSCSALRVQLEVHTVLPTASTRIVLVLVSYDLML